MSLLSFLREADFLTSIAVDSTILCFAFEAYRRCQMKAFAFLIWGSVIGIIMAAGMRMHRAAPATAVSDALTFWQLYRVGYIAASVLWSTGILLLIRYVTTRIGQGAVSNLSLEPATAADVSRDSATTPGGGSRGSA